MLINAISVSVLVAFFASWSFATNSPPRSKPDDKAAHSTVRVTTKGDELSIVFPVKPTVDRFKHKITYEDLESITEERVA
ncbi:MAG: hypothetical protein DMF69_05845, partial [Acidobacteria bacterium]